MCYQITAILQKNTDITRINAIAKKYHRFFAEINDNHINKFLSSSENYYSTLSPDKTCDCGTGLGWYTREQRNKPEPLNIKEESKKLARKGWSDAKINRWIESKEKDLSSYNQTKYSDTEQETKFTKNWHELLSDIIGNGEITSIGLLLHWYGSSRLKIKGRKEVTITHENLAKMEEDIIYVFKPTAP